MSDVIVVGAGIIGCTVAETLRRAGSKVLLLDAGKTKAATPASGGHMNQDWFGDLPREEANRALTLLDQVWGLREEEFHLTHKGGYQLLVRVDTVQVLEYPRQHILITAVNPYFQGGAAVQYDGKWHPCRHLVLAAGVWCNELLPGLAVKGKQGVSFQFRGKLVSPFIQPWAPYKQIVAHQQGPGEIWVGDGSAILERNWTERRTEECLQRCAEALPTRCEYSGLRFGVRPYHAPDHRGEPCLFRKVGNAWLITGAGKSGTIAAGWAAERIRDAIHG